MNSLSKTFSNKLKKLGQKEKLFLSLGAALALVGIFYFSFLSSNLKTISDLKQKIENKKQEVKIAGSKSESIEVLQKEYQDLIKKIEEFELKIPKEAKIALFISDLTDIASRFGIGIKFIQPQEIDEEREYVKLPIEMGLTATPENFIKFLDELAKFPRLVSVKGFKINAEERALPEIGIELSLSTYTIKK